MFARINIFLLLLLPVASGFCAPSFLLTHNLTAAESNAYIITRSGGSIPSIYPTPAYADSKVHWNKVKLACHGHTKGNLCSAMIKMAIDTPHPIEIGVLTMDLNSGEITPNSISAHGYTVTVNGIADTTITFDPNLSTDHQ